MQTIGELRQEGRAKLAGSSEERPGTVALEVDVLLGHVLGWSQAEILSRLSDPVGENAAEVFSQLVARRATHEPVAYITGKKEFFGLDFEVTPAVLIPRPETELVVEQALKMITSGQGPLRIIDVGTGSGAIVVALLATVRRQYSDLVMKRIEAIALDLSSEALEVARRNANRHEVETAISFLQSDVLQSLNAPDEVEEIILANPPYIGEHEELPLDVIGFEPRQALFSGADGLEVIFKLLEQAAGRFSGRSGSLVMEIGHRQRLAVEFALNSIAGVSDIEFLEDLQGISRVVVAKWQECSCRIS